MLTISILKLLSTNCVNNFHIEIVTDIISTVDNIEIVTVLAGILINWPIEIVLVETQTLYYMIHSTLGLNVDIYPTGHRFAGIV